MNRNAATLITLGLFVCAIADAQFSGAVEGFVKDGTGAVIPGADVVVTDENLGLERETTSNETGFFRVSELPAGSYAVTVASPGFTSWSTTSLLVRSDETRTLYPAMQIGEVTTSITIEADTSAVNTTEVDNTNYIDEESLNPSLSRARMNRRIPSDFPPNRPRPRSHWSDKPFVLHEFSEQYFAPGRL